MDLTSLAILSLGGLMASLISTISGSGGGIILFAILNLFYAPKAAIAIHALTQIVSKITRIYVFKGHVKWKLFTPFAIGSLLGITLASFTLYQLPIEYLQTLIGFFLVIYSLFKKHLKKMPFIKLAKNDLSFLPLGFVGGFLSMGIGAAGPFMTPFMKENMEQKEVFIATKAFLGLWVSVCKSVLFLGFLSFPVGDFKVEIIFLCLFLFIGTLLGKKVHTYMSEKTFDIILRTCLLIVGVKLLYKAIPLLVS